MRILFFLWVCFWVLLVGRPKLSGVCGRWSCMQTITRLRAGAGMQRIKQNVNPFSAVI